MSRQKFIAANWKLNIKQSEAKDFLLRFSPISQASPEIVLCPSFTSLATVASQIQDTEIQLGAQDMSQYSSGAYTGEISAEMLLEIGVQHIIIGHSERRMIFKEDDSIVNAKMNAALNAGLRPILCCGESEQQREQGQTDIWVSGQIAAALENLDLDKLGTNFVVAYEPIWAIGTGKVCDSSEANRVISVIRAKLKEILGDQKSSQIRILYGGSVKSSNVSELMSQSDIDGALVGGASLDPIEFAKIINNANSAIIS